MNDPSEGFLELAYREITENKDEKRRKFIERSAYICCWKINQKKFNPKFLPLDMVQDNTRSRVLNVLLMVIMIMFIYNSNQNLNAIVNARQNSTADPTLGDAIVKGFQTWGVYLAISLGATLIAIPMYIGTATSQHYLLSILSLVFVMGVCTFNILCFYYAYIQSLSDPIGAAFFYTQIVIQGLLCSFSLLFALVLVSKMKYLKNRSFYDTKLKDYKSHVMLLLRPFSEENIPASIKHASVVDSVIKKIMDYLSCCGTEEGEEEEEKEEREEDPINKKFRKILREERFFFPQRFHFALFVSIFLSLMFFCDGIGIAYSLERFVVNSTSTPQNSGQTAQNLGGLGVFLDSMKTNLTNFPNANFTALLFNVTVPVPVNTSSSTSPSSTMFTRITTIVRENILGIGIASTVLATLFSLLNWLFMTFTYQKRIMEYRRGVYKIKPEIRLFKATQFVGLQIAASVVGWWAIYGLFIFVLLLIVLCIYEPVFAAFAQRIVIPSICTYIAISFPLGLMDSYVITKRGIEIRPSAFYIVDLFYVSLQFLKGIFSAVFRAVYLFFILFLHLSRFDVYLLPGEAKMLDVGTQAYQGMIYMEHRYNNPVSMVFRDVLLRVVEGHPNSSPEEVLARTFQFKIRLAALLTKNPSLQRLTRTFLDSVQIHRQQILDTAFSSSDLAQKIRKTTPSKHKFED